jgi:hypothetical protein
MRRRDLPPRLVKAADETHHVKMLDDGSVFGDSDSGTAANR